MNRMLAALIVFLIFTMPVHAQEVDVPNSKYYPAIGEPKHVAIMMLGGSEGGLPDYYDVERFTRDGYSCLVVGYFHTRSTPDRLELIPLEYFEEFIGKLISQPGLNHSKIVVWGGSKGGELALLLASRYDQIEGVIAAVPSAVVFQGIGGRPVSSWSYMGESIPFVPYVNYDWSKIVNSQYLDMYEQSLAQTEAVQKATIEVEKINGPILLLTGKADTMWPSSRMGHMIVDRLKKYGFTHMYWHYDYDNAGHTLNESFMMGGTFEGNRVARLDADKRVIEFLEILAK